MKKNNFWKRFWTMNVHNHEGFTLVELIIVIAILAILSGVAVVGYSAYIEKANKQADQTMVSEIKNALTLYYYSHMDEAEASYIILKPGQTAVFEGDFVNAAMQEAYGTAWTSALQLQWNGWISNADDAAAFVNSSFNGKTEDLLGTMGELTGALSGFLADVNRVPSAITGVLTQQGVDTTDPTALANGTVVALATTIDGATNEQKAEISAALQAGSVDDMREQLDAVYAEIYPNDENMVTMATAATLYAAAEAYSQFAAGMGDNGPANALENINYYENDEKTEFKSAGEILTEIQDAFDNILTNPNPQVAGAYMSGTNRADDANAFLAVMGALSDSSDILKENLTSSTFYTDGSASSLVNAYLTIGALQLEDGQVAIIIDENGNITDSISLLGGK